jgi:hypothetical protein
VTEYRNGTLQYRVGEAEKDIVATNARIDKLEAKLNTILMAVIGLALSIAGSAIIFALTIISTRGGR